MTLFKCRFNNTVRKVVFFSQKVIDHWNNVSYDVVASDSVVQFKSMYSCIRTYTHSSAHVGLYMDGHMCVVIHA